MSLDALTEALAPTNHAELEARSTKLDQRMFDMEALLKAVEALHNELELEPLCALFVAIRPGFWTMSATGASQRPHPPGARKEVA